MTKTFDREYLEAQILFKLARHRKWGGSHTELANVRKVLPQKYESQTEELVKDLVGKGYLTWLKKTNQIHVSLNSHRRSEILALVEKYFGKQIW